VAGGEAPGTGRGPLGSLEGPTGAARYLTREAEWRHWSAFAQAQLELLTAEDVVAVCYHFPEPGLGRVVEEDGRQVWRPEVS
jgi:hypothetical protein